MKKLCCSLLVIWLATGGISAAFAEEECANAVDAADSMNVNQKDCDYSDKGLNGFLQKAFKKGSEGAVLNTSSEVSGEQAASKVAAEENISASREKTVLSVEVEQWANVGLAKNQLLQKVMERCSKGFNVQGETYRPLPMGRIELSLEYHCL
jgi:hypothetical protein